MSTIWLAPDTPPLVRRAVASYPGGRLCVVRDRATASRWWVGQQEQSLGVTGLGLPPSSRVSAVLPAVLNTLHHHAILSDKSGLALLQQRLPTDRAGGGCGAAAAGAAGAAAEAGAENRAVRAVRRAFLETHVVYGRGHFERWCREGVEGNVGGNNSGSNDGGSKAGHFARTPVWICKDALSNGARDLYLVTRGNWRAVAPKLDASFASRYVLQKYVQRPLLWRRTGCKFHLRVYAVLCGDLTAHVYRRCFAHVASKPYAPLVFRGGGDEGGDHERGGGGGGGSRGSDGGDCNVKEGVSSAEFDRAVHITNVSANVGAAAGEKAEGGSGSGNIRGGGGSTFHGFPTIDLPTEQPETWRQIGDAVSGLVAAAEPFLKRQVSGRHFGLLGLDFLLVDGEGGGGWPREGGHDKRHGGEGGGEERSGEGRAHGQSSVHNTSTSNNGMGVGGGGESDEGNGGVDGDDGWGQAVLLEVNIPPCLSAQSDDPTLEAACAGLLWPMLRSLVGRFVVGKECGGGEDGGAVGESNEQGGNGSANAEVDRMGDDTFDGGGWIHVNKEAAGGGSGGSDPAKSVHVTEWSELFMSDLAWSAFKASVPKGTGGRRGLRGIEGSNIIAGGSREGTQVRLGGSKRGLSGLSAGEREAGVGEGDQQRRGGQRVRRLGSDSSTLFERKIAFVSGASEGGSGS